MPEFRGAFHLHSRYSYDGQIPLQEMAPMLKEKGYSFGLMSEHAYDRAKKRFLTREEFQKFIEDCRRYSSPDFLLVPGLEFACYDNKVHLLTTPLPRAFSLEGLDTAPKILETARRENALAFLVHPFYGKAHARLTAGEFSALDGFEIWNYNYQRKLGPSAPEYFKSVEWLKRGNSRAIAGLDLHRKEDLADISIKIKAEMLKEEIIFEKLRAGDYGLHALKRKFDSKGRIDCLPSHWVRRTASRIKVRVKRFFSSGK